MMITVENFGITTPRRPITKFCATRCGLTISKQCSGKWFPGAAFPCNWNVLEKPRISSQWVTIIPEPGKIAHRAQSIGLCATVFIMVRDGNWRQCATDFYVFLCTKCTRLVVLPVRTTNCYIPKYLSMWLTHSLIQTKTKQIKLSSVIADQYKSIQIVLDLHMKT